VRAADDAMHLDRPVRVADLELRRHREEAGLLARARHRVGTDAVRLREGALEVGDVVGLGDDDRAFGDRGAHAAGMVEVRMTVDRHADRFARGQPLTCSITACVRASLRGVSTRIKRSCSSIATLLCEPPATNQTPSATFSEVTRSATLRAASGTAIASAGLTCTSVTVRSSTG
jgi:hypothetical protein